MDKEQVRVSGGATADDAIASQGASSGVRAVIPFMLVGGAVGVTAAIFLGGAVSVTAGLLLGGLVAGCALVAELGAAE